MNTPRLRTTLIIQEMPGAGAVLKDPARGTFFRLGPVERFIAAQLDGTTPLSVIRQRAEQHFDGALPDGMLERFVRQLDKAGLLEGGGTATEPARPRDSGPARRLRGSALYLRLPLVDPDRLLSLAVPHLGFLFTRRAVIASLSAIACAVLVTITRTGDIAADLGTLYRLSSLLLLVLVLFAMITLHELAHGATCKHFGGEVREMGFMLIYFQPAFYCNVSDAWLFPEKSRRLWVSLAGAYAELVMWALATLVWWLTAPGSVVNHVALLVMLVSGIKSLLNFNPLIKLDGYYVLSDWLEIPNLRRKAFTYVGEVARERFGWGAPRPPSPVPPRERRIYLWYGTLATAASIMLLTWISIRLGGYFIEVNQPMALLFLTGLVGAQSRQRLRHLFRRNRAAPATAPGTDSPAPPAVPGTAVVKVAAAPPAPSGLVQGARAAWQSLDRGKRRRTGWAVAAVCFVLLLVFAHRELRIGGAFNVLPEDNANVRAAVEGTVEEVLVEEGQRVIEGDVIARLSDRNLRVDLARTEAELREARANLAKLEMGPAREEIVVARAALSQTQDRLQYAQSRVTRMKTLFDQGSATRQELENAEEDATLAGGEVAESRGRLNVLLRGSRVEDVAATRARVDGLESQVRFLEEQLALLRIVSPVNGVVATPARELRALENQLITRGTLVARVVDFSTVRAQIVVPEKEIADVKVGQRVVLRARAYPNHEFPGTVTAIGTSAEESGAQPAASAAAVVPPPGSDPGGNFIVTTVIDNRNLLLKPGMTGQAKVLGGSRRLITLMTRRLARTIRVEVWSWL